MGSREALSLETSEDFCVFYGPQASTSIGTQGSLRRSLQSDWGSSLLYWAQQFLPRALSPHPHTSGDEHITAASKHPHHTHTAVHTSTLRPNSGRSWLTRGLQWLRMSLNRPPIVLNHCLSCCPVSSVTVSAAQSSLFERMKPWIFRSDAVAGWHHATQNVLVGPDC